MKWDADDAAALEQVRTQTPEQREAEARRVTRLAFDAAGWDMRHYEAVVQRVIARTEEQLRNPPKIGDEV